MVAVRLVVVMVLVMLVVVAAVETAVLMRCMTVMYETLQGSKNAERKRNRETHGSRERERERNFGRETEGDRRREREEFAGITFVHTAFVSWNYKVKNCRHHSQKRTEWFCRGEGSLSLWQFSHQHSHPPLPLLFYLISYHFKCWMRPLWTEVHILPLNLTGFSSPFFSASPFTFLPSIVLLFFSTAIVPNWPIHLHFQLEPLPEVRTWLPAL